MPETRIKFQHEVINQHNEIINTASSTMVFVDANTRKPMIVPEIIHSKIESYLKHNDPPGTRGISM